jgi:hypothetical protein
VPEPHGRALQPALAFLARRAGVFDHEGRHAEFLEERRGKAARLVLGEALPDDVVLLPTVDDLAGKLAEADAA